MPGVVSRIKNAWSAFRGGDGDIDVAVAMRSAEFGRWADDNQRYDVLEAYYRNDDLYRRLAGALRLSGYEGYQNVGNPANRIVEVYAAKLADKLLEHLDTTRDQAEDIKDKPPAKTPPGEGATTRQQPAPPPEDRTDLKEAIKLIWKWSNWESMAELSARYFVMFGDLYIRAQNSEDGERVHLDLLDPRDVTDFDKDIRGHFTFLRLDIPIEERISVDEVEEKTRTEIWDKVAGTYQIWIHEKGKGVKIEDIPDPPETWLFTADPPEAPNTNWTGYDFVPVVHRELRDIGEPRGAGCFQHALDEIDALAEALTRLNSILFPKVTWKLTRQYGPGGAALQPYQLEDDPTTDSLTRLTRAQQQQVGVTETSVGRTISLGSGVDMLPMIAQHDFGSHILAIDKAEHRLEKTVPELGYYRVREYSQPPSGRAAYIMMMDIVDRLGKARAKFEDTLVRVIQMAITLGKLPFGVMRSGPIEGFANLGEYDTGALGFTFEPYELFPISPLEEAESDKAEAEALAAILALPAEIARPLLERRGITPPSTTLGDATLDAQREAIRARASAATAAAGGPIGASPAQAQDQRGLPPGAG